VSDATDLSQGAPTDPSLAARHRIDQFLASIERQNHFQLLGASPDTDPEKLKLAYKSLAKQWHADAYAGLDLGGAKAALDQIFSRIQDAYETLIDPKRRAEYMVFLDRRAKGLSTDVGSILLAEQIFDQALAELRRSAWREARESLEKAAKLNPDDPLIPVHHAWARYNEARKDPKNVEAAVEQLQKATAQNPGLDIAWQLLGQICFSAGRAQDAKRYWKKCLELDPRNVEATRGMRLLTSREHKSGGIGALLKNLFTKKS
jgi:curved DNA-binding protein CbpA